jgi:hypothetical protein
LSNIVEQYEHMVYLTQLLEKGQIFNFPAKYCDALTKSLRKLFAEKKISNYTIGNKNGKNYNASINTDSFIVITDESIELRAMAC